jgi:hypothetical protein
MILYPFLLSFIPAWILILKNIDEIILEDIMITMGIVLVTITMWVITRKILSDGNKAGIIIGLGVLIFFYFGYVQDGLSGIEFGDQLINKTSFLGSLSIIFFFIVTGWTIKSKRKFKEVAKIANVVTVVFVIVALIELVPTADAEKPNIYHIILDEYTDEEILGVEFGYDNKEFITFLSNNGFIIPEKSFSVFTSTDSELLTILNFEYPNITDDFKSGSANYQVLKNNNAMKKLSDEEYHIIETNSIVRWKDFKEIDEKLCYNTNFINSEFLEQVLSKSIIRYFLEKNQENSRRDTIKCTLEELNNIPLKDYEKPVYVFSHMYIPHPPFLFGPNGENVVPDNSVLGGLQSWESKTGYINQLKFASTEIKKVILNIIENDPNAIIILQGDTGTMTGIDTANMGNIKEIYRAHSILFALRVPGIQDIENPFPVNTYRIIFNNFFNSEYEYLPEMSFDNVNNTGVKNIINELRGFEYDK